MEEGLFSHHRPQFSVWCAGYEIVLCILLSDPKGMQMSRTRAAAWERSDPFGEVKLDELLHMCY